MYDIIILDLWYHYFESMISRTYDIIGIWYHGQYHRFYRLWYHVWYHNINLWYHKVECMISITYDIIGILDYDIMYDIIILDLRYHGPESLISRSYDSKDPWYHRQYHKRFWPMISCMISWSWIYDIMILDLWYQEFMIS
jgi:hypothetical protein